MQKAKNLALLSLLYFGSSSLSVAQVGLPEGSQQTMLSLTTHIADIDTSLQINQYSLAQRKKLFERLFQADQQYRHSLNKTKQDLFWNRVVANDKANQAMLSKIVHRFGWPTRKEYGDQATYAAWLIVWHSDLEYQNRYYPLIKSAYQRGLIQQNPIELEERLRQYFR